MFRFNKSYLFYAEDEDVPQLTRMMSFTNKIYKYHEDASLFMMTLKKTYFLHEGNMNYDVHKQNSIESTKPCNG